MEIITVIGTVAAIIAILQFSGIADYKIFLQKIPFIKKYFKSQPLINPNAPYYLAKLPDLSHQTIGREEELQAMTTAIEKGKQVVAIVASGGVGKTTLVRQWLENFKHQNYGDFNKIFARSFYNQGTHSHAGAWE